MLPTIVTLALLGQPLPDAMDHLKSADVVPNVGLLLDASCSMAQNPKILTTCSWFASSYTSNSLSMTKNEVMRATLVGCQSATDGILDKWAGKVNFSLFDFGRSATDATLRAPFGSSLATLEAAAIAVPATGSTPITNALRAHGRYFSTYFNDTNSQQCRPNFIVLLTDGDPNGGGATFDWNCAVAGDPRENLTVNALTPWLGADYMTRHKDLLCGLTGEQKINTHAIGFGAPGSFNPANIQRIADAGQGSAYVASSLGELDNALSQMISSMVVKSAVFTSGATVELDQLFAGNFLYAPAFRPNARGPWSGTLKKHCIEPARLANGRFDTRDKTCVFASDDGERLVTNPAVEDLWTGTTTTGATRGGAGLMLLDKLGAAGSVPLSTNLYPRKIQTWRPNGNAYVDVRPTTWLAADTFTTAVEHAKLVNQLHGYTAAASSSGAPLAVSSWPYGDPVHSTTVLLRYGKDCETANQCFVLVGANDGMLHVHDAANGVEKSALIPAELWNPTGVANNPLRTLSSQPDSDANHRYFVDGGMSLFHDDTSGDGVIQATERAYLVFGLGRGGAAYYLVPVSSFNGVFDTAKNPVRPLTGVAGTAARELRDTWATPWLGVANFNQTRRRVAVFGTGHIRANDEPSKLLPAQGEPQTSYGAIASAPCGQAATHSGSTPAIMCNNHTGHPYSDVLPSDVRIGAFSLASAGAYRLVFDRFDLDPNDALVILDQDGSVGDRITGTKTGDYTTPWIYGSQAVIRWVTNGRQTSNRGWRLKTVETMPVITTPPVNPIAGVWITDLDKWNGASPRNFASTAVAGANIVEIASRCTTSPEVCVDARSVPALADMTCPVSTEISVLTTADQLTALYWGDECGQLWKAWPTDATRRTWSARKVLALNTMSSMTSGPIVASKDMRKLFRRVDVVPSTCPGQKVIGLYFGTGNVQRPAAIDELANPAVTNGRDVVGVVWDVPGMTQTLRLSDLSDVTSRLEIDASAPRRGWFWSLRDDERMLRDPLVFDGVAYFKTFQPVTAAAECRKATGVDTIYAVDNCSAKPESEGNTPGFQIADRAVWTANTDVGGNLMLMTPQRGGPMVSALNMGRKERASVLPGQSGRVPRIFHWREPRREGGT